MQSVDDGEVVANPEVLAAAPPAEDAEFEVVGRDSFNVTFRTRVAFYVRSEVVLTTDPPVKDGVDSVALSLRSAYVLADDRIEYTATCTTCPTDFARWTGVLALRDHTSSGPKNDEQAMIDKRRGRRLPRTFQVTSRDLQRFKALSSDISETGLRLMADEDLAPGKNMGLIMDFDDFRFPPFKCRADVIWCRPRDQKTWWVGLKFTEMSDDNRDTLLQYVEFAEKQTRRRPGAPA